MIKLGIQKITIMGGLLLVPLLFFAQGGAGMHPFKITIFQDAVQVGQKGIIRFYQQSAEVPMDLEIDPRSADLLVSGDFDVEWFRFRNDSTVQKLEVRDWNDILRANISKHVSLVYEIATEYDEVSGDIRWVDERKGFVLLRGDDDSDYFIPLDKIQQVVVETFSDYKIEQKVVQPILEVHLSKDAPFVPIELFSLHQGITWEPVCRIRIVGSERAVLEMNAMVENQLHNFKDVEVEISPGSIASEGQMSGDIAKLGKISLEKGDQILVNFRRLELKYEQLYEASVPWMGVTTNERRDYPVRKLMRFDVPVATAFSCNRHAVLDENNRNIANIGFSDAGEDGKVELDLGEAKSVTVTVIEAEKKRAKKPIKIGEEQMIEVGLEGKLIIYNVSDQALSMDLSRELKGNITGTSGGDISVVNAAEQLQQLKWKIAVEPGQKKEIRYKYDTYLPYEK